MVFFMDFATNYQKNNFLTEHKQLAVSGLLKL